MHWAEIAWLAVGATFLFSILLRYVIQAFGHAHDSYRQYGLEKQINELAQFIMDEIPGEPSESEGAVECSIRVMREFKMHLQELDVIRPDECLIEDGLIGRVSPGTSAKARSGAWVGDREPDELRCTKCENPLTDGDRNDYGGMCYRCAGEWMTRK